MTLRPGIDIVLRPQALALEEQLEFLAPGTESLGCPQDGAIPTAPVRRVSTVAPLLERDRMFTDRLRDHACHLRLRLIQVEPDTASRTTQAGHGRRRL